MEVVYRASMKGIYSVAIDSQGVVGTGCVTTRFERMGQVESIRYAGIRLRQGQIRECAIFSGVVFLRFQVRVGQWSGTVHKVLNIGKMRTLVHIAAGMSVLGSLSYIAHSSSSGGANSS
jgi:hypothetical protein